LPWVSQYAATSSTVGFINDFDALRAMGCVSEVGMTAGQQHLPIIRTIHGEDFYAIVIESHKKYMMHCLDLKH
jgi:hypothetical protein